MKRYIKSNEYDFQNNAIEVEMLLMPIIYENSEVVVGAVVRDNNSGKYTTDVNPYRVINGPFSEPGEELESPIIDEYHSFLEDCEWLVNNSGFTILKKEDVSEGQKSRYLIVFGMNDKPCGSIVFNLRISDHPLDATFPENIKDEVLELLKIQNVLNGSATKAGIDFQIEKVLVGGVKNDTWARAFNRLGNVLDKMRIKVRKQLNREKSEGR